MKVIELENKGHFPNYVFCKFYKSHSELGTRVMYTTVAPPHQYFKVMKTVDKFGSERDVGVDFGDYLVYDGNLREVLKKDTLAHKAMRILMDKLDTMGVSSEETLEVWG